MSNDQPPPALRPLELLLTGYGFNYYNDKNKMRADDLLVRQRAAGLLDDGVAALTSLESDYQRRHVPPSSREQPFPPRETLDNLRDLDDLRAKVQDLSATIRAMPVPTQDRIWWRLRSERVLLDKLLHLDLALIEQANAVSQSLANLAADTWHFEHPYSRCVAALRPLQDAVRDRRALLQFPA